MKQFGANLGCQDEVFICIAFKRRGVIKRVPARTSCCNFLALGVVLYGPTGVQLLVVCILKL